MKIKQKPIVIQKISQNYKKCKKQFKRNIIFFQLIYLCYYFIIILIIHLSNQIIQTKTSNHKVLTMNYQQIVVCQKHNRKQTNLSQISNIYYVCMNRYCPSAYTILCSQCRVEHRDHQVKILSIEDIAFMIDRLLKMPFRQAGTFIAQSVQVLKRLKLVTQFSKKITNILKQLHKQTLDLINMTQNIVGEYSQCKNSAQEISQALFQFQSKEAFQHFKCYSIQKLSKIDYNTQKDRFQYGNLQIKQKQDERRKNLTYVRRKIQQIKQCSMKIIQVILNTDQSEQQQQDIGKKKKLYETLKKQVINLKFTIKYQQQKTHNGTHTNDRSPTNAISSRNSINQIKLTQQQLVQKQKNNKQKFIQTQNKWIQDTQKKIKQLQNQLQRSNFNLKKLQNQISSLTAMNQSQKLIQIQLKGKIMTLQRQKQCLIKQKQNLRKQKEKIQKHFDNKHQIFVNFQKKLRQNFNKRSQKNQQKNKIMEELSSLFQHQKIEPIPPKDKRGQSLSKNF